MDRVKFIQSIESPFDLASLCNTYFDQFMGLYSLIPDLDFTIYAHPNHPNADGEIDLRLSFQDEANCRLILENITNQLLQTSGLLNMYNHQFHVSVTMEESKVIKLIVGK